MPIRYLYDSQSNVIFVLWYGTVTWEQWRRQIAILMADPVWQTAAAVMADVRSVSDVSTIGQAEIDEAVQLFAADPGVLRRMRIAIIATGAFGRANLFRNAIAHWGTSVVVFNALDTACLFLGLNQPDAIQTLEELRQIIEGNQ